MMALLEPGATFRLEVLTVPMTVPTSVPLYGLTSSTRVLGAPMVVIRAIGAGILQQLMATLDRTPVPVWLAWIPEKPRPRDLSDPLTRVATPLVTSNFFDR